jgi:phage gp36-like protein
MAYCTDRDVQLACGGSKRLIELTDLEETGALNAEALEAARQAAEAWINSKIGPRYAVALVFPYPAIVVQYAAQETKYQLMVRRGMVTTDEKDAHQIRDDFFTQVRDGKASLGEEPYRRKSSAVKATVVDRSASEDISRDSLKGTVW